MSRNTLFSLMGVLEKTELPEFAAFLNHHASHKKNEFATCFDALCSIHPAMDPEKLPDESLFALVFENEPYEDIKLRRLKSELCRLIEDFLAYQELKSNARQRSELLTQALERRGDYPLYKETINKRLRKLDAEGIKGKAFFEEAAFLYQSLYYHPRTERVDKDNDFLQKHIDHLENYFAISFLESGAESLVKNRTVNASELLLFADTSMRVAEKKSENTPVIHSYLSLFRLLNQEVETHDFFEIKKQVLDSFKYMDAKEKKMALKLLTVKAYALTKSGSSQQIGLEFEFYKKSIEEGLSFAANGVMEANHFINVVITASRAGAFDWAHQFIEKYKRFLPTADRKLVKQLCLGSIYFQQGMKSKKLEDFEKVLGVLASFPQRSSAIYNLRFRSLSIRSYFELFKKTRELDTIEKQVKNFESYLRNNYTLSKSKKEEYHSFLIHFRALYRLYENPNSTKKSVEQFLKKLAANRKIIMRDWLQQKAEELRLSLRY